MVVANPEGMIHALKSDSPGSDNDMKVFKVSCFCFHAIYKGSLIMNKFRDFGQPVYRGIMLMED